MTSKPVSSAVAMNRDQIWQAIDAQRTSLADLLEQLADEEWLQPSLCAGWTVRDVAAHLTLQQLGPGATLGMMFKWQGSLDRTIQHVARLRAVTLTTGQNHRRDPGHDRLTAAHLRRHLPGNPHRHPRAQPGHRAAPRPPLRYTAGCRGGRGQPGVVDALAAAASLGTENGGDPAQRHGYVVVRRRRPGGPGADGRASPGLLRPPRRPAATVRRSSPRPRRPPIDTHTGITLPPTSGASVAERPATRIRSISVRLRSRRQLQRPT